MSILQQILAVTPSIRYAALYRAGKLISRQRDNVTGASAAESDKYEELFVNPSLLTLVRQRGNLDCGGADFILVRYGNFYQLIVPLQDGHVSVCFEPDANPLAYTEAIRALVE